MKLKEKIGFDMTQVLFENGITKTEYSKRLRVSRVTLDKAIDEFIRDGKSVHSRCNLAFSILSRKVIEKDKRIYYETRTVMELFDTFNSIVKNDKNIDVYMVINTLNILNDIFNKSLDEDNVDRILKNIGQETKRYFNQIEEKDKVKYKKIIVTTSSVINGYEKRLREKDKMILKLEKEITSIRQKNNQM